MKSSKLQNAQVVVEDGQPEVVTNVAPETDGKLFINVAGSQGGVGKTTTLVDLVTYLAKQGVATTKIDLDEASKKIGSFAGFFPDVIRNPLSDATGYNTLLRAIDQEPNVILVDSPASTTMAMTTWFEQYHSVLHRHGHRFWSSV